MTKAMRIYHNNLTEGWLLRADVLFAIGRYLALAGNLNKAKDYIRRAIKLNGKYRSEFLEDDAFDAVWESF